MKKQYDLEERMVKFAGETIFFSETLPNTPIGAHLASQVTRSATSAPLNFGEAHGAGTDRDMIHKCRLTLKELKETRVTLKILKYVAYGDAAKRAFLLQECEELIAIIASIIKNKSARIN